MQTSLRKTLGAFFAATIASVVAVPSARAAATYHVDMHDSACSDGPGFGSEAQPYCTLNYVSTIAEPGDTFLINSGRYGHGPTTFTRSGTEAEPITYRAVGDVVIGSFVDPIDEDFQPTDLPNVYSLPWTGATGKVWQTHFAPILVDDPNSSKFTMVPEDGPLMMKAAPDEATLVAQEGMYRFDTATGLLLVHAYSNRIPSTAETDFVVGTGKSLNVNEDTHHNVFDGFRITYLGSAYSFQFFGSHHQLLNMKFQGHPMAILGGNSVVRNVSITHAIERMEDGDWLWHYKGSGTAGRIGGPDNRLENIHVFHNWNSALGNETATGTVIDGARIHGAPNHCGATTRGNTILRNVVMYNCQDYVWLNDIDGFTIEHMTVPSGVGVEGIDKPLGPITVRNSIFSGSFHYVRGDDEFCTWEAGSLLENSIISESATIERCGPSPMEKYPILEYIAKCESGEFSDCMTIRNNVFVNSLSSVLTDGGWNEELADTWDFSLLSGSPAIDTGVVSGALTDIMGVPRPQGAGFDIGAHEFCVSDCVEDPPSSGGAGGAGGSASSSSSATASSGGSTAAADGSSPTSEDEPSSAGCGCRIGGPADPAAPSLVTTLLGLLVARLLRRRRAD